MENYLLVKDEKQKFFKEFVPSDDIEHYLRLCSDYECLDMKIMAEKRYKDLLIIQPKNHKVWHSYCLFKLRSSDFITAEEALWKALELDPENLDYKTLLCCFFIRRKRPLKAKKILEEILAENRESILHNTFIAFLYIYFLERKKLGRKYFNVSQRVKMRHSGYLPPKSDKPDLKALEKLPELSPEEKDDIWMELISFFSANCMFNLTKLAIQQLNNQETFQVNLIHSSLTFFEKDYNSSDGYLDKLLELKGADDGDILMRKAMNSFMLEKYYEAEEYIFRALKAESKACDFATLLRLGYIYLKRESTEDANIILSKACAEKHESCLAWLGLAISSLKLDYLQEAEKALKMANILDPINSDVWGYTILLGLKDPRKLENSLEILEKYLNLEIEDLVILCNIGESLMNLSQNEAALKCFKRVDQTYGQFSELMVNRSLMVHKVYWLIAQLEHEDKNFAESLVYYDKALEGMEGETHQTMIREMREEAVNQKELMYVDGEDEERDEEYSEGLVENYL
jgi:Tfp pilus assembly protein PilF